MWISSLKGEVFSPRSAFISHSTNINNAKDCSKWVKCISLVAVIPNLLKAFLFQSFTGLTSFDKNQLLFFIGKRLKRRNDLLLKQWLINADVEF
jgi:hypothetical protein